MLDALPSQRFKNNWRKREQNRRRCRQKLEKQRERERDGRVYEAKEKKMLFLSVG